jgi:F0F1-type ATP synthase delta subunit
MQKGKFLNAKNLAEKIKILVDKGQENLALALLESSEIRPFLNQITSILKRQKGKLEEYNTCKILTSNELSEEALESILKSVNYKTEDKLIKIVSPQLGVGAFVTYRGLNIDATLSTMVKRVLKK